MAKNRKPVQAFLEHRSLKVSNTQSTGTGLILYGHLIAEWDSDGMLHVSTKGWNTVTTFDRLNQLPNVVVGYNGRHGLTLNNKRWDGTWAKVDPNADSFVPYTEVIFRKFKDGGDIVALFPNDVGTYHSSTMSSYMHVGQHGSADRTVVIGITVPATYDEYEGLKNELESDPYNYNLDVVKRITKRHDQNRRDTLETYKILPENRV